MFRFAANLELLFHEAGPALERRAEAAANAGFDAVELWGTASRNVDQLSRAFRDLGLEVTCIVAEPNVNLVFPGADLIPLFDGLKRAVDDAHKLGCCRIVVRPGMGFPGFNRERNLERLTQVYSDLMDQTDLSGVVALVEPVNTRLDHPGLLIDRTMDAIKVLRAVNSPKLRLLFDFYHSATEAEGSLDMLAQAADLVEYVQFADVPGRGEPGSGTIDWRASLSLLTDIKYVGPIGLEYVPTAASDRSIQYIMALCPPTENDAIRN